MAKLRLFITIFFLFAVKDLICQVNFDNVANSVGIDHSFGTGKVGGGVSFYDFNGDGWDDLTFACQEGDNIHFYENQKGTFKKIKAPVEDLSENQHLLWVDFDNDGDQDLFVSNHYAINSLFQNDGSFQFINITSQAGLPREPMSSQGVAWADYDRDGWLDVYITQREFESIDSSNRLFRNLGNGTFEETTLTAGVSDSTNLHFCTAFFDYNNDGWEDIYLVHDLDLPNKLYKNNGDGTFQDVSKSAGIDFRIAGMGIAIGDYDQNGYFDVYNSNVPAGNKLFKNNGDGTFNEVSKAAKVEFKGWGWSVNFLDADNDTHLDLYVTGTEKQTPELYFNAFYLNNGDGSFRVPSNVGFVGDTVLDYSNAIGDFNNDGYPDVVTNNHLPNKSFLWKNSGGKSNWLKLELIGDLSNRDAIGAKIAYFMDGKQYLTYVNNGIGFLSQNSRYPILGLADHSILDSLYIIWPSGHTDHLYNLESNQRITIKEGSKTALNPSIQYHELPCGEAFVDAGLFSSKLSYQWSTGETTAWIKVDTTGEYGIEVKGEFGNYQGSLEVSVSKSISLTITSTAETPSVVDGSATVEVVGGEPPFTYQWNDPLQQNTATASGLAAGEYEVTVTDHNGCIRSTTVKVSAVTGLREKIFDKWLSVYPNPSQTYLRIDKNNNGFYSYDLRLVNLWGKEILYLEFPSHQKTMTIDVANIPKGLYLLVLEKQDTITGIKKVIIE